MHVISILKDKYGKDSEILKADNKEILELPVIFGVSVEKIHEVTDRLTFCVQSLETMGKLDQVNGNVSVTLDKLPAIRGDLVRMDYNWENLGFWETYQWHWTSYQLLEAILFARTTTEKTEDFVKFSEALNYGQDAIQLMSIHLRSLICPLAGERSFSTQECKITRTTVTNKVPAFIAMTGHLLHRDVHENINIWWKEAISGSTPPLVLIVPEETIQPWNVTAHLGYPLKQLKPYWYPL